MYQLTVKKKSVTRKLATRRLRVIAWDCIRLHRSFCHAITRKPDNSIRDRVFSTAIFVIYATGARARAIVPLEYGNTPTNRLATFTVILAARPRENKIARMTSKLVEPDKLLGRFSSVHMYTHCRWTRATCRLGCATRCDSFRRIADRWEYEEARNGRNWRSSLEHALTLSTSIYGEIISWDTGGAAGQRVLRARTVWTSEERDKNYWMHRSFVERVTFRIIRHDAFALKPNLRFKTTIRCFFADARSEKKEKKTYFATKAVTSLGINMARGRYGQEEALWRRPDIDVMSLSSLTYARESNERRNLRLENGILPYWVQSQSIKVANNN